MARPPLFPLLLHHNRAAMLEVLLLVRDDDDIVVTWPRTPSRPAATDERNDER